MEFTLVYRGPLKAAGNVKHKQHIRRAFHAQLEKLWTQVPLNRMRSLLDPNPPSGKFSLIQECAGFQFAPLVNESMGYVAELDITLLRSEPPGSIITQGGDIDNRLKTLFDALRMPKESEFPSGDKPRNGETPFFCLLEDDSLITKVSVSTECLLEPGCNNSDVLLLIKVRTKRLASGPYYGGGF